MLKMQVPQNEVVVRTDLAAVCEYRCEAWSRPPCSFCARKHSKCSIVYVQLYYLLGYRCMITFNDRLYRIKRLACEGIRLFRDSYVISGKTLYWKGPSYDGHLTFYIQFSYATFNDRILRRAVRGKHGGSE